MNTMDQLKRWFGVLVTLSLVIVWCPGQIHADSTMITQEDLEFSDPFEIKSSIMEIDYGKTMLIVAENSIYVVDLTIGTESVKSILTDENGRPILFDSLERGQTVVVSGMLLPDGRVIAEDLVLISDRD